MSERAGTRAGRQTFPRMRTYGRTVGRRQEVSWLLSRESLLRLILSFVLAMALWTYINIKQDPTVSWDYPEPLPIATEGLGVGLTVANNLGVVRVRVRLDNRNIPVSSSSFHPFVNLSGLGSGFYAHLPVDVVADPGIHVIAVSPRQIPVALEAIATRHVPVRLRMLSGPPRGYEAGNILLDPNTVTISGPESAIDQVTDAAVYVDLSQARYSIDGFYKPSPETSSGETVSAASRITVDPEQVHINVPVQAVQGYKSLPILSPIKGQPRTGFGVVGVAVNPNEITAYGPPAVLNTLSAVDMPVISVANRSAGSFNRTVRLQLPRGVTSRTEWVKVTIQLAAVAASSSIQAAVIPRNLATGLSVHTNPPSVLVTLVGPASKLRNAAGSIDAAVNLAGYGTGTFQLTPSVIAPHGLRVEGVYPSTVTVTITSG